jgi:hypothetical protein
VNILWCYFCIKLYSDALQTIVSTCYFEIFIISDLISTHKFMKIHIRTHNYHYYKMFQLIYRYEHSTTLILHCATLFRALRTADGRWDAEEGHGDPSQACICLNAGRFCRLEWFGCTFRGFLVIVSSCRFRWAQAPTVNYPGLLTSRHLWIFKREKQIV